MIELCPASTSKGSVARRFPMILGVVAILMLMGCQKAGEDLSPMPPAALIQTQTEHPAKEAARNELGAQSAEAMEIEHQPPIPPEAGAIAIIRSIVGSLPQRAIDAEGMTWIGLGELRNHSRSSSAEFAAFTERFTQLLSTAGRSVSLRFTAQEGQPVHYELLGTVYLTTVEGFDQWELFLRLSPADDPWTLWQCDGPIRVLRTPRPGGAQITLWPVQ